MTLVFSTKRLSLD